MEKDSQLDRALAALNEIEAARQQQNEPLLERFKTVIGDLEGEQVTGEELQASKWKELVTKANTLANHFDQHFVEPTNSRAGTIFYEQVKYRTDSVRVRWYEGDGKSRSGPRYREFPALDFTPKVDHRSRKSGWER